MRRTPLETKMISGYFKTTSPQGDGNQCDKKHATAFHADFKTTSPQGDGNTRCPAIGSSCIVSFQNHIPARGRKPCSRVSIYCRNIDFKTTSPQGDGNIGRYKYLPIIPAISKPHPRKGTETVENTNCCGQANCRFQNHIPARGRKP